MGADEERASEYRALFREVYDDAVRFAMRRAEPADAEEAVATALTVAWRRFGQAPSSLDGRRAWVFGIVRKTLMNQRRGNTRRAALAVRLASSNELEHRDDLSEVEFRADLAAAWSALPAPQQEVLALAVFEQLDANTAARVLGILPGTYRVRLSRARKTLQAALTRQPPLAPSPTTLHQLEAS